MRFWPQRKKWELRTERVSFSQELYVVRGGTKVFICELYSSPTHAERNIAIIEKAMVLVDVLNARSMKDVEVIDSLRRMYKKNKRSGNSETS